MLFTWADNETPIPGLNSSLLIHRSGLSKGLPKHTAYCFAFGCHLLKVESTSEHGPETAKMGLV